MTDINNELNEELDDNIDKDIIDEEIIDEANDGEGDGDGDADFDIMFKNTANKHKIEGKHSLVRDTIFKGKLEEDTEEEGVSMGESSNSYDIMDGTIFYLESRNNEEYQYKKKLCEDIHNILDDQTELDFTQNRRKPNRQTFNNYYKLCINQLSLKYTKSEIFVELSYYFTDNIFNMFKLLDKSNATGIIMELKDKGYLNDIGNINFI